MMASVKDYFIQSHELFFSREMQYSFGDSWLCPAERVPKDFACGLSFELFSSPNPVPSGKGAVLTLPKFSKVQTGAD